MGSQYLCCNISIQLFHHRLFSGVRMTFRHVDATFPKYFIRTYGPQAPWDLGIALRRVTGWVTWVTSVTVRHLSRSSWPSIPLWRWLVHHWWRGCCCPLASCWATEDNWSNWDPAVMLMWCWGNGRLPWRKSCCLSEIWPLRCNFIVSQTQRNQKKFISLS